MSQQPAGAAGRGLLLIGAAVLIGFVLLSQGFGDEPVSTSAPADDGEAEVTPEDTTPDETIAQDDAQPTLDPSQVTVVVANASGQQGLAGQYTETLAAAGYITSEPTNATADATAVYFLNDFQSYQAEAEGVATAAGLPASVVQPLPPDGPGFEATGAELVYVILGPDIDSLAGGGGGGGGATTTVPGA